jgi:hypothetical protein
MSGPAPARGGTDLGNGVIMTADMLRFKPEHRWWYWNRRKFRQRFLAGRPLPPQPDRPMRTLGIYSRRISRFSPLRLHYPDWVIRGDPPPPYDVDMALELLRRTGDVPDDENGLLMMLREYRHALDSLVDICAPGSSPEPPA